LIRKPRSCTKWNSGATGSIKYSLHCIILKTNTISLQSKLQQRIDASNFRELRLHEGLVDFCSNDYLGLATSLKEKPGQSWNTGSGGSRLLAGNYPLIEELEKSIASFHDAEAGLIFNSGYDANIGLLSCIALKEDTILYDQLIHASLRDGSGLDMHRHFRLNIIILIHLNID
jgi:8-amino-7-oxononanoate synthase